MLEHGGQLRAVAARYKRPIDDWVDLSTGINPYGWPAPRLPSAVWARLPEQDDGLVDAACAYYGARHVLPVAGSQAAIQMLPVLHRRGHVGVLNPAYAEHALAWQRAGHTVTLLEQAQIEERLGELDTLVVINPNNPTGDRFDPAALLRWHKRLAVREGWLIVDEAFMDATPGQSLAAVAQDRPGLIVLRSLGKFFGLPGARVGFVIGEASLLAHLSERLGPWTVSGPSRFLARRALADRRWHEAARERLHRDSLELAGLLAASDLPPTGGTAFFQWVRTSRARRLQDRLARQGIWTRCFDEPASLRFGLPGTRAAWEHLSQALAEQANATPACERQR